MQFLSTNNILSSNQHGFLARHSTCTNLLESLHDWSLNLDDRADTIVAFFDFAKAFDKVSFPKLMFKLNRIGIRGNLLNCISSFLNNRSQSVRVGSALSSPQPVISGVPQGSVLGPILFLIFINDVTDFLTPDVKSKLFADDLKSYVRLSNDTDASVFSLTLKKISEWARVWQLPLSTSKCCYMLISNRCDLIRESFTLNEVELEGASEVKDLGILFTKNLNFTNHITSIIGKAKQRLFLIHKSFITCDPAALIKAFKVCLRPLLEYCSQVWSPHHITEISRTESVLFSPFLPKN